MANNKSSYFILAVITALFTGALIGWTLRYNPVDEQDIIWIQTGPSPDGMANGFTYGLVTTFSLIDIKYSYSIHHSHFFEGSEEFRVMWVLNGTGGRMGITETEFKIFDGKIVISPRKGSLGFEALTALVSDTK